MLIAAIVYLVLLALALAFNHGASVLSGNHEDPYRDAGQDGRPGDGSVLHSRVHGGAVGGVGFA